MTKPLYAQDTSVPVERSRAEIERVAEKHGATGFMSAWTKEGSVIVFEFSNRRVRFRVPNEFKPLRPNDPLVKKWERMDEAAREKLKQTIIDKEQRRLWRSLVLIIKAKLEAVASGITTFEHEFLSNIVVDGRSGTVGDQVIPALDQTTFKLPPLLGPGPKSPK